MSVLPLRSANNATGFQVCLHRKRDPQRTPVASVEDETETGTGTGIVDLIRLSCIISCIVCYIDNIKIIKYMHGLAIANAEPVMLNLCYPTLLRSSFSSPSFSYCELSINKFCWILVIFWEKTGKRFAVSGFSFSHVGTNQSRRDGSRNKHFSAELYTEFTCTRSGTCELYVDSFGAESLFVIHFWCDNNELFIAALHARFVLGLMDYKLDHTRQLPRIAPPRSNQWAL